MLKLPFPSLVLGCLALGTLAACDTGVDHEAQGAREAASAKPHIFAGTLDRTLAGETIPAVEVIDPAGTRLALAETAGTPVLLNLWATWCAPCIHEMPLLDELAGTMEGELRVLTVSMDLRGAEVVEPFFEERDLDNLPRWMDPQNALAAQFGGGAVLPLTILYDAQGAEVFRVIGDYDWASEEARAAIREGLAQGS